MKLFRNAVPCAVVFFIACQTQPKETTVQATSADSSKAAPAFTVAMVDNRKDPSCGMPVTAGIGDTVHYDRYVIGFCSKECKDDFLNDPVAHLTAAEFRNTK